jgi:hypothetical protein
MAGSSSRLPASRRLHDHHEHAAGGNAAPNVANVQLPLTADLPAPYRPCLPPSRAKHLGIRSPDSTRLLVLTTGRVGVVFARGEDGKRPPSKAVASETEAQRLVAAHRALGKTGIRRKPEGER